MNINFIQACMIRNYYKTLPFTSKYLYVKYWKVSILHIVVIFCFYHHHVLTRHFGVRIQKATRLIYEKKCK